MAGGNEDNGSEPPPFDSLAGLRALGEVQRRGLEAANQVVSRLVQRPGADAGPLFGAETGSADGSSAGAGAGSGEPGDPVAQFAAMAETWMAAVSEVFSGASAGPSTRPAAAPEGIAVDPLVMPVIAPGTSGAGEFWLHNNSGEAVREVRLHCGDLRSHCGGAIGADRIRFDPPEMAELPDRSSRGITLSIDVPHGTRADVYRGAVLASNLPEVWLPVEVRVAEHDA